MAGNELVKSSVSELLEGVVLGGDLSQLSPAQRLAYYKQVCEGYEDQSRFAIMQKVGMTK